MSFLLWFSSFLSLWTVQVEWVNRILDIPLFENIQNYKEIPVAELFIDGKKINDPLMYYERDGVDHTFFSVITTSHVRSYTMRYRVYFPTYGVIHTEDIIFNIVDLIPPVIEQVQNFRIPLGQSMPDLDVGFIYLDNYDETDHLQTSINSMEVILDKTGIYPIYYQVSDLSGNISYATGMLEVYDFLAPTITLKHPILLAYKQQFIWQDFIGIKDNDDAYPYVFIDDSLVDYTTLGNYPMMVYATDKNGLSANETFILSIIDDEPPKITVKSQPPSIPVFSSASEIDFLSYVIRVEDNYDLLEIDDLIFDYDIEFNVIGQYYIYYHLTDYSGNSSEIRLKVNVIDDKKPEIVILYPLLFDVFDVEPFFIDYIDYFDNYTSRDQLNLKMNESVKMDVIGKYPFTIDVTDGSNNKTTLRTYIEIVDRVSPIITQYNDILITDFTKKDLTYYFEASDNYDETIELHLYFDDSLVDYEHIGSYPVKVFASDSSDNVASYDTEIIIIDIEEPEMILKQNVCVIEVFDSPIDFSSFVIEVSDNYDLVTEEEIQYIGQVIYEKIGIYPIEFILSDSSMNTTSKMLYVTVDDLTPPTVDSATMTLYVGDYFDPLLGLEINDNLEKVKIEWFPQFLDTSIPGTKIINYIIMDSRGNYTTHQRTVIVAPIPKATQLIEYVPVALITMIGIGAGIYFYKRMS